MGQLPRSAVVTAMVGDPADGPALGGAAADRGQDVLKPLGPGRKAPVSQEPVIGHADADPARQPVQDEADEESAQAEYAVACAKVPHAL